MRGIGSSAPGRRAVQVPGASDELAAAVTVAILAFLAEEAEVPTPRVRPWARAARSELVGGPPIATQADLWG